MCFADLQYWIMYLPYILGPAFLLSGCMVLTLESSDPWYSGSMSGHVELSLMDRQTPCCDHACLILAPFLRAAATCMTSSPQVWPGYAGRGCQGACTTCLAKDAKALKNGVPRLMDVCLVGFFPYRRHHWHDLTFWITFLAQTGALGLLVGGVCQWHKQNILDESGMWAVQVFRALAYLFFGSLLLDISSFLSLVEISNPQI